MRVLEADLVREGRFVRVCRFGCGGGEGQGADLTEGGRERVVER